MSDNTTDSESTRTHKAGAFDIRTFIGALLGLYGLIILLTGFFGTDDAALAKSDGLNVNIWTGAGLLVASAIFIAWARLRPVVVPDDVDAERDGRGTDGHGDADGRPGAHGH